MRRVIGSGTGALNGQRRAVTSGPLEAVSIGAAHPVQNAAQQFDADADAVGGRADGNACGGRDSLHVADGGDDDRFTVEADDFAEDGETACLVLERTEIPQPGPLQGGFDNGADNPLHPSIDDLRGAAAEHVGEAERAAVDLRPAHQPPSPPARTRSSAAN